MLAVLLHYTANALLLTAALPVTPELLPTT
jgi:hypothetical protein